MAILDNSQIEILVCPVSKKFLEYGENVYFYLDLKGYEVELDRSNHTLNKKIMNGQLAQFK
jgi:threonyl-tRNA synthetase